MAASARRLVEEIASLRHVLRNVFRLAMEVQETSEYVRYVDIYGTGSLRLVRLLALERPGYGRLEACVNGQMDQALREIIDDLELNG